MPDFINFSEPRQLTFHHFFSLLVIARSSDPPIVLFDIVFFVTQEIDFDGSAQALSVDEHYKVVYWSNFDGSPGTHNLMRTFWETGQTKPLNISYDGDIDLAQDYMHLYVLDKDNDRIDKYHKRTWRKVDVLYTNDGPVNLIVAFGMCQHLCIISIQLYQGFLPFFFSFIGLRKKMKFSLSTTKILILPFTMQSLIEEEILKWLLDRRYIEILVFIILHCRFFTSC